MGRSTPRPTRTPIPLRVRIVALAAIVCGSVALALPGAGAGAGSSTSTLTDVTLANPSLPEGVMPLGQGRVARSGGHSYLLYAARYTADPWVQVRDEATGQTTHLALAPGTTGGTAWARADLAVSGGHLWVLSGAGPVYLRHYALTDAPLATGASLVSERVLGDTDSRAGALAALADGSAVAAWHQQGATGPQGLHAVRATPGGGADLAGPLPGIATRSSTQAIALHPVDGSVWLFSSADAGGAIAAVRMVAAAAGLEVDRVDPAYLTAERHGAFGPDPEAPDVEAVADPTTRTIAVAYQSAERRVFSVQPWVVGSHLAIARVGADGSPTFVSLPVYVERLSAIGLAVDGSDTWLAYRPVADDLSFDALHARRHDGSRWADPVVLGTLGDPRAMVYFGGADVVLGGPMADNLVHLSLGGPVASGSGGSSDGDASAGGSGTGTDGPSKGRGGTSGGAKRGPKR